MELTVKELIERLQGYDSEALIELAMPCEAIEEDHRVTDICLHYYKDKRKLVIYG